MPSQMWGSLVSAPTPAQPLPCLETEQAFLCPGHKTALVSLLSVPFPRIVQGLSPVGRSWHSLTPVSSDHLFLFGGFTTDKQPLSKSQKAFQQNHSDLGVGWGFTGNRTSRGWALRLQKARLRLNVRETSTHSPSVGKRLSSSFPFHNESFLPPHSDNSMSLNR